MTNAYNTSQAATSYREFLGSNNGRIFRDVVGQEILARLSLVPHNSRILDAGCGNGWLAGLLAEELQQRAEIHACDAGQPLIDEAAKQFPGVHFAVCDLNAILPYPPDYFDLITASMVLHDVSDLEKTMQNLATVLKTHGRIIASIVNPYYGYPVGEWKRGLWGRLLGKMPRLRLARSYQKLAKQNRPEFEWRPGLVSQFTPLSVYISAAKIAGLMLRDLTDLYSAADSPTFDLHYQLHRFPIILILEFSKDV